MTYTTTQYHEHLKDELLALLAQARLPVDEVRFAVRAAQAHAGEELVATTTCRQGHEITASMQDLRKWIDNKFFNDISAVPYLCPHCAYPDQDAVAQKKATVFHRLAILRKKYPEAHYLGDFSTTSKEMEAYGCGETFSDGTPHPYFTIRYDKLAAADRAGPLRHSCYICGLMDGEVPETKTKTLEMLEGRMRLIGEALAKKSGRTPFRPVVEMTDADGGPLSTSKTVLRFSCGNPEHPPVERTADNYFKSSRGGYCAKCLAEHGMRSVAELRP